MDTSDDRYLIVEASRLSIDNSNLQDVSNTLTVYTDGSCTNNGTDNAKAGIGIWVENQPDKCISRLVGKEHNQTNQVAELLAVREALRLVNSEKKVDIYTDSRYVANSINNWYDKWKSNNWKKADGKTPLNLDIIKDIMETIAQLHDKGCIVKVICIKGHNGNIGNENANNLAIAATRQNYTSEEYVTYNPQELLESKEVSSIDLRSRIGRCIEELVRVRDSL